MLDILSLPRPLFLRAVCRELRTCAAKQGKGHSPQEKSYQFVHLWPPKFWYVLSLRKEAAQMRKTLEDFYYTHATRQKQDEAAQTMGNVLAKAL